ncbi:hypothetical protein BV96_03665 [Sphingomonas paucimobilis]|nr:hypothetical protein BV96_03665 [Sphingomonas paucimobilis]
MVQIVKVEKLWYPVCLMALLVSSVTSGALAQTSSDEPSLGCPEVGANVAPVPFDSVASALAPLARPKGEYETTDSFNTRQQSAATKLKHSYLVSVPLLLSNTQYDADRQVLSIPASALGGLVEPDYGRAMSNGFIGDKIGAGLYNIDVIASQTEVPTGSYAAQNAMGATTRVTKFRKVTKAIFDRAGGWQETLFDPPYKGDGWRQQYEALEVQMTPAFAKNQRRMLRAAVLIRPHAPWLLTGQELHHSPTLDTPNDFDATLTVMTARIGCVVIIDKTGKVLGERTVRQADND